MILSTQLSYQELQLKWALLLLEKSFQVDFPWISFQHKFCPLWRNSVQCIQAHKIRKPIFIKEVGHCIFMHNAPRKSGTTKLKALKTLGLSAEYCGWRIFMWRKVKAETQILCGCSVFALIKIWGRKELPSIHSIFFFPKLHFSYKYPWKTTLRIQ